MRLCSLVLLLGCGGSKPELANTKQPAPVAKLPGACVDPKLDATHRLEASFPNLNELAPVEVTPIADLDGDGIADRSVVWGLGIGEHAFLYVMRERCGHFVGDVEVAPQLETTRTNGFLDLTALDSSACEGARCGCESGRAYFVYNGSEYLRDAARSTESREKVCADGKSDD